MCRYTAYVIYGTVTGEAVRIKSHAVLYFPVLTIVLYAYGVFYLHAMHSWEYAA
jgi:hypothetical protein